jgi:hypothetical protein
MLEVTRLKLLAAVADMGYRGQCPKSAARGAPTASATDPVAAQTTSAQPTRGIRDSKNPATRTCRCRRLLWAP